METRKTILVVEDEPVVAMDLQQSLERLGYDVPGTAASAEEALRLAEQKRLDLALIDIRIEGSLDGIATAEILRSRFGVPVIYLTAHADKKAVGRAKQTAPHAYLLKPVRTNELRIAVELALHKSEIA
jgi:CheY-like chemotaxis protein